MRIKHLASRVVKTLHWTSPFLWNLNGTDSDPAYGTNKYWNGPSRGLAHCWLYTWKNELMLPELFHWVHWSYKEVTALLTLRTEQLGPNWFTFLPLSKRLNISATPFPLLVYGLEPTTPFQLAGETYDSSSARITFSIDIPLFPSCKVN